MSFFSSCKPDFAVVRIWPHMPIDFGFGSEALGLEPHVGEGQCPSSGVDNEGNYNGPLGHAGILLIQAETGLTRYFEWGRYRGNRDGAVNTCGVPTAILAENGWSTKDSLHNISRVIARNSGKNTWMHGNFFHKCGGFDPAVAYAQSDQGTYNVVTKSCITYAQRVNRAGGFSWFGPVPV